MLNNLNNKKSHTLKEDYLSHGDFVYRHSTVPTFIKAKGVMLEDADGLRYFDRQ